MPDYIKRSSDLHEWLLEQGITVEPDGKAPIIWRGACDELMVDLYEIVVRLVGKSRVVCPYYGPGGADNSLKAVNVFVERKSGWLERVNYIKPKRIVWGLNAYDEGGTHVIIGEGEGKTDGIALAELLWKIKEASE